MNLFAVFTALILSVVSINLYAGPITSGGGDDVALEFLSSFRAALSRVERWPDSSLRTIAKVDFKSKLPDLKVTTVTTLLETMIDGVRQESTAMNYPQNQLIKINRDRWNSISSPILKEGLALHEMLSLIGKEGSGQYRYSSRYVSELGLAPGDLVQSFQIKRESKTYYQNKVKYTITATERFISNQVFETVRIDYVVKRDGKELVADNNIGGMMYACHYGDYLPNDFVDVLGDGNSDYGFVIKGLGVCGNTSSERWHVVVPTPQRHDYGVRQINTKTKPETRVTSQGVEFWYLQQEWGKCGTAGSFFVPTLLKIQPGSNPPISDSAKLPSDIKMIPQFPNFQIDPYMSLFTAGLRTHDGLLMKTASQHFKSDKTSIDHYKWCGLPDTQKSAFDQAEAMLRLQDSLDTFL